MNSVGQRLTVVLVLLLVVSLGSLTLKPTTAQTITKPSVPDFTVKYVDRSYYVPPVYGVDPYSGKTVQTGGGFTVTNKTLEITIMGQSFTPYVFTGDDGLPHEPSMMWDIAYKGHFGDDWTIVSQGPEWNESSKVIVFGLGTENQNQPMHIPADSGDQIDFEVRARIGYSTLAKGHSFTDPDAWVFHGETSDWSATQTISIPDGSVSVSTSPNPTQSQTPTQTPTVPEFPATLAVLVLIVLALAVTIAFRRKPK